MCLTVEQAARLLDVSRDEAAGLLTVLESEGLVVHAKRRRLQEYVAAALLRPSHAGTRLALMSPSGNGMPGSRQRYRWEVRRESAQVAHHLYRPRAPDGGRAGQNTTVSSSRFSGAADFQAYCASCHGPAAKGDGVIATSLVKRPPDLTRLAKRHGDEFPEERVFKMIEGRSPGASHRAPDMPVWATSSPRRLKAPGRKPRPPGSPRS